MEEIDKSKQKEWREQRVIEEIRQTIPKRKRTARQHGLRFSGKTSEQFQQDIQSTAAKKSLGGRNVSEREVLSGDHSNASEVPSTYPVYYKALGWYIPYSVVEGNPTTDNYAFIDCMAISRGEFRLHFTNGSHSDRFPPLDPTTGHTKYLCIGRSHGEDDLFWLPSHEEFQQILRASNQQMQEGVQGQQLPIPDPDPAGLFPRQANLTGQDESQVALSPDTSSRSETERRKIASRKRRELMSEIPEPSVHSTQSDSSWEPEPSARLTETRPTKKRKALANQTPSENQPDVEANRAFGEAESSRLRSYEEWKKTEEGQDPNVKPVRSPGRDRDKEGDGQIYGYRSRGWQKFCEETNMEVRPPEDQINRRTLNRVLNGEQSGAGTGEWKWTSPDPAIQGKMQEILRRNRERINASRQKPREQASEEGQNLNLRPVRSPGETTYWYDSKNFEGFCKETSMQERPPEDQIGKRQLDDIVRGNQRGAGTGKKKWISPDSAIQEKLEKRLQKKKENNTKVDGKKKLEELEKKRKKFEQLKKNPVEYKRYKEKKRENIREYRKKLKEDHEYCKSLLEKKYKIKEKDITIEISRLKTSMDNADPSQQAELKNAEQDLIRQWKAFERQYKMDLEKVAKLSQELRQRPQYKEIEGELDTLIQRYLDNEGELESHDLEDDHLNEGADLSLRESHACGEARPSRPRSYEEWKASEEGQDPDLKPVCSPGGQIWPYNPEDFEGFCEETNMLARPANDQIEKKVLDRVIGAKQLGAGKGKEKWTSPDPAIQIKREEMLKYIANNKKDRRERIRRDLKQHREDLNNQSIDRLMKNEKFKQDHEYRKRKLQELMEKPEFCKAFFDRFLKRVYKRKKEQYKTIMSRIDTNMKDASTSQRDGGDSRGKSIKRGRQQAKHLNSLWDNFQKRYQADLKKLDELIDQLEQLQRAPEQDPSTSERDEPSNQQRDLQQHMEAIGGELGALIQRYGSNDDERELYDVNNLGERELHNLENDLLNDFADSDDSSRTQSD